MVLRRLFTIAAVVLGGGCLFVPFAALAAQDPIVGTWTQSGIPYSIAIAESGAGMFTGTVKVAYNSSNGCPHQVGQQAWEITRNSDGSYTGWNHGFASGPPACPDAKQSTTWTIGQPSGGTLTMYVNVNGGTSTWTRRSTAPPTPTTTTTSETAPTAKPTTAALAYRFEQSGVASDDPHLDAELSGEGKLTGGPAALPSRHKIVEYGGGSGVITITLKKLGTKTLRLKLKVTGGQIEVPGTIEKTEHPGVREALAVQGAVASSSDPKSCPAGSEGTVIL